MAKPAIYLTAQQIEKAVRESYSGAGYICLSQVRNGTGYARAARTADMLAVSTFPSRGLFAEGIEIKCALGDLKRELSKPEKAEEIARFCSYWWIAVPQGLTADVKVPPGWGIIEVDGKLKAKVLRPAPLLNPEPMDALFVCSVLRSFSEGNVPRSEVDPLIAAARAQEKQSCERFSDSRLKALEDGYTRFHIATGIDLLERNGHPIWTMGDVGQAIKLLVSMKGRPVAKILEARESLAESIKALDAALVVLDDSPPL